MADPTTQTEQAQAQAQAPASNVPDTVTQLQTCLDQYLVQLYASIKYINTRHPLSAPIEPLSLPPTQTASAGTATPSTSINGGPGGSQSTLPASQPQTQTPSSLHSLPSTQQAAQPGPASQALQAPHPVTPTTQQPPRYVPFTDPLHDPTDTVNPPSLPPPGEDGNTAAQTVSPSHQPLAVPEFQAAIRELAQDLVAKQKQIEGLVGGLPEEGGAGAERERQEARLKELEAELGTLGAEVRRAAERKGELIARVDGVMGVWAQGRGV